MNILKLPIILNNCNNEIVIGLDSYINNINKILKYFENKEDCIKNRLLLRNKLVDLFNQYKNCGLIDKSIKFKPEFLVNESYTNIHFSYYYNNLLLYIEDISDIFKFNTYNYKCIIDNEIIHSTDLPEPLYTIDRNKIHITGLLDYNNKYNVFDIKNKLKECKKLENIISEFIIKNSNSGESSYKPKDRYWTNHDISHPKVSMEIYVTNKQEKLNDVIEKKVLASIGELDLYSEDFGYSEYSILGYNILNFTLGGHDLNEIFKSYNDKYIHIIMELMD